MSAINLHIKSGQNKWDVSIEPSQTILELKEAIAVVSSIPAANQRLIYSGKILKDDQTVESYKIQDGHAVHLVRSGGNTASSNTSSSSTATTTTTTTTRLARAPVTPQRFHTVSQPVRVQVSTPWRTLQALVTPVTG